MANEDAAMPGPDPVNPNPVNPTPDTAGEDALKKINELYSQIIGKTSILTGESKDYYSLLTEISNKYDKINELALGLEGTERKAASNKKAEIRAQVDLILQAEKYLTTHQQLVKEFTKEAELIKGIARAGELMGLTPAQIGTVQANARADYAIAEMGKRVAGWTQAFATIGQFVNIGLQSQMAGAMGRGVGAAQGAGINGLSQGDIQSLSNRMFGAAGAAMGPVERVEALNKILREAPAGIDKSGKSLEKLIGTMGFLGANTDQIVQAFVTGTRNLGLSQDELIGAYRRSTGIAKNLGLGSLETADTLLKMTGAARQAGGSIKEAQSILLDFSKITEAAGVKLTGVEKSMMAGSFAAGVFGMSVDKLLGLAMYTSGRPLNAIGPRDIEGGSALGIAKATFEKISQSVGGSYAQQLLATQQTARLIGINANSLLEVRSLQEMLKKSNRNEEAANKELEQMANPALSTAKGIDTLIRAVDPLKSIDNTTKQMLSYMSGIGLAMQSIIGTLAALQVAQTSASAALGIAAGVGLGGVTKAATRAAAKTLLTATGEEMAIGEGATLAGGTILSGGALPLVLGGMAAAGGVYAAYRSYQTTYHPEK